MLIARCMVDMKHERCKDYKRCSHAKPHDRMGLCFMYSGGECQCVSVPLKYYIEEILDEKEEENEI